MLIISEREKKSKEDIEDIDTESEEIKQKMIKYEKETGKYAIWRGLVTEGFKKWLKGEKIYDRDKERISLYVSEDLKDKWQDFLTSKNYTTLSKLIRDSVNYFIDEKSKLLNDNSYKMDLHRITSISHALKEPLTTIKGFSQLLLENYKDELSADVLSVINNIFDQSNLLESKIINILDDIDVEHPKIDILLIEDDLPTIRLITTYFESKGYICKGAISGSKGIEELENSDPKLVLIDIILPDLSGYELCKKIKESKKYKELPVFYLTAIPSSEVEKKMEETKADGFILKPFDFSDFNILFQYL